MILKEDKIFDSLNNVISVENIGAQNPEMLRLYLETCKLIFDRLSIDARTGDNNTAMAMLSEEL